MLIKKTIMALSVGACLSAPALSQAALLGLVPAEPLIDLAAGGVITYTAADGTVTISGTPQQLLQSDPFLFGEFVGTGVDDEKLVTIQFKVDGSGGFVSGVDGPDLIVKGGIDVNFDGVIDYDGVLLEAEVSHFGFQDAADASSADGFDLRLDAVTGALAPLYAGQNLAIKIDSEASEDYPTPFAGSFSTDFIAPAKGSIGAADPLPVTPCKVKVDSYCSVNGGPNKTVCRIKTTKSPKHWEHVTHYCKGNMFRIYKYGMHGDPVPSWASRYQPTDVKFTYVVKNTGTTPITNLQVIDSFDPGVSGVPSTLAPGASVTLMRTEALRDGILNSVLVTGESGESMCMDRDTTVVKDKTRKMRHHDYDRFKNKDDIKGRHDD